MSTLENTALPCRKALQFLRIVPAGHPLFWPRSARIAAGARPDWDRPRPRCRSTTSGASMRVIPVGESARRRDARALRIQYDRSKRLRDSWRTFTQTPARCEAIWRHGRQHQRYGDTIADLGGRMGARVIIVSNRVALPEEAHSSLADEMG